VLKGKRQTYRWMVTSLS